MARKSDALGEYLAARRKQVHPEQVGLDPGSRRRVAGLRREEVTTATSIPGLPSGNGFLMRCLGLPPAVPRNTPHRWRNIASEESRLLAIITPGGFEQIVYALKDTPPEKIRDLAARFG